MWKVLVLVLVRVRVTVSLKRESGVAQRLLMGLKGVFLLDQMVRRRLGQVMTSRGTRMTKASAMVSIFELLSWDVSPLDQLWIEPPIWYIEIHRVQDCLQTLVPCLVNDQLVMSAGLATLIVAKHLGMVMPRAPGQTVSAPKHAILPPSSKPNEHTTRLTYMLLRTMI